MRENKIARLESKLAENSQKTKLLNLSLSDIKSIGNAAETYKLAGPSSSDGTHGVVKGADGASPYEGKYQRGEHIWLDVVIGQDTDVLGAKQRIKDALEACLAASNQESIQAAAK